MAPGYCQHNYHARPRTYEFAVIGLDTTRHTNLVSRNGSPWAIYDAARYAGQAAQVVSASNAAKTRAIADATAQKTAEVASANSETAWKNSSAAADGTRKQALAMANLSYATVRSYAYALGGGVGLELPASFNFESHASEYAIPPASSDYRVTVTTYYTGGSILGSAGPWWGGWGYYGSGYWYSGLGSSYDVAYSSQIGSTANITLVDPGKQFGNAFWRIDPSEIVDEVSYGFPEDNYPDWTANDLVFMEKTLDGWLELPESSMLDSDENDKIEETINVILNSLNSTIFSSMTTVGSFTQEILRTRPTFRLEEIAPSLNDAEWNHTDIAPDRATETEHGELSTRENPLGGDLTKSEAFLSGMIRPRQVYAFQNEGDREYDTITFEKTPPGPGTWEVVWSKRSISTITGKESGPIAWKAMDDEAKNYFQQQEEIARLSALYLSLSQKVEKGHLIQTESELKESSARLYKWTSRPGFSPYVSETVIDGIAVKILWVRTPRPGRIGEMTYAPYGVFPIGATDKQISDLYFNHINRVETEAAIKVGIDVMTMVVSELVVAKVVAKGMGAGITVKLASEGGASNGLIVRQGNIVIQAGTKVSASEAHVAKVFADHGYDVTHVATASSKGIQNLRTADLLVDGIGRVDVFTPKAVNATSIARAIESKGTQAPVVVVSGNVQNRIMQETVRRMWGKTSNSAKAIQNIVFENNGVLTWFSRP